MKKVDLCESSQLIGITLIYFIYFKVKHVLFSIIEALRKEHISKH